MQPFTFYVIHHSHTDIGYTDYQEKIEQYQVQHIRDALHILDRADRDMPQWQGFKWNCESFWAVERFLKSASAQEKQAFSDRVKHGQICVSANYLNFNELISADVLHDLMSRVRRTAQEAGFPLNTAMTADINGYAWGYAQALCDAGVTALMTNIHTHHGLAPLHGNQQAFWWETPGGQKLLVWIGNHYMLGNELGLANTPSWPYMIHDGLQPQHMQAEQVALQRLPAYRDSLRKEGYTLPFAPVSLSSCMTDNAAPSEQVAPLLRRLNEHLQGQIHLQMVTLDEFFEKLRQSGQDFPTHRGDMADWWADGASSTPQEVRYFREAQRLYSGLKTLGGANITAMDSALDDLTLYAEHTWGHSASVSDPFDQQVSNLMLRKHLYAFRAHETLSRALDEALAPLGDRALHYGRPFTLAAQNLSGQPRDAHPSVELEVLVPYKDFSLHDAADGEEVPYQLSPSPRGHRLTWHTAFAPLQTKRFLLKERPPQTMLSSASRFPAAGADGVNDLAQSTQEQSSTADAFSIRTPHLDIGLQEKVGIVRLVDRRTGKNLLRPEATYPPFTPIYERTPAQGSQDQCGVRRRMGRNRKASHTQRSTGVLREVRVLEQGALFSKVMLHYDLAGCERCTVTLTAFTQQPRLDVRLSLQKHSVWDPENLYLALPFTADAEGEELWVDKTGALLRPRVDQLPGSCCDFYLTQNGLAWLGGGRALLLASPDVPLISMGELPAHPIRVMGDPALGNLDSVYSWVMNNFWETNFNVDLGGFHSYDYSLLLAEAVSAEQAFDMLCAHIAPLPTVHSYQGFEQDQ